MANLGVMCEKFFAAAARHHDGNKYLVEPDPIGFVEGRDQVFQFEIEDGKPFYLTIEKKNITATEGLSSLDWQGKDWNKISHIWTDEKTLKAVVYGDTDPIAEWHKGRWDFASRIGNSPYHSWFCILIPMAREQLEKELVKAYLAKEVEKGLAPAMEKLLEKVKGHPEGGRFLTQPEIVKDVDRVEKWEHTFQFEPEEDSPFYVEIAGGNIMVKEGISPLDWRIKDWESCTRVWSEKGTLEEVILGEKDAILEWHDGRWDFSSRIASSHFHSWFCIIMLMAREQLAKELLREHLS
jgi:hypothetical protein